MRLPLKHYLALLVTYLKPQRIRALLMALLLLFSIGLQLLNPQILRYFIDSVVAGTTPTPLIWTGLSFVAIALINQITTIATSYLSQNVAWTATNQLRTDLVTHCLSLDMAFHKTHTSGEMIERIDGDVDALSNFFSQFVVYLLGSMILLLAILILFFQIHWLIGSTMTAFSLITLLILSYIRRRAVPHWLALRQINANFFGFLGEQLAGTEDMRALGATSYIMRRFHQVLRSWSPINRRAGTMTYLMSMTTLLIFILGNALALSV